MLSKDLMSLRPQEGIRIIDPTLRPSQNYGGSVEVYSVEKEGKLYILKWAKKGKKGNEFSRYGENDIRREARLLERASGIQGITHLVEDYGTVEDYVAIRKEYFPGISLGLLKQIGKKIEYRGLMKKLCETVVNLHSRGIVDLEIAPRNVVIGSFQGDIRLIEIASGRIRENLSKDKFNKYCDQDWQDLKDLETDCFF